MIAVDTNILLYAHRPESKWHTVASAAIIRLAEGKAPWAIPWPCIHEFLGIATNLRVFSPPTPPVEAIQQVEIWMESPTLLILGEQSGHWQELCSTFLAGKFHGARIHDARIHSICRSNGVREFWSADRDFSRMRGLTITNPCLG